MGYGNPLIDDINMMKASTSVSPLRKIGDDSRLRPFLSSLFDSQTYIKSVIKDGQSEECFANITKYIEEINAEIKSYISQHKVSDKKYFLLKS
jgi:hypothetical protein